MLTFFGFLIEATIGLIFIIVAIAFSIVHWAWNLLVSIIAIPIFLCVGAGRFAWRALGWDQL